LWNNESYFAFNFHRRKRSQWNSGGVAKKCPEQILFNRAGRKRNPRS